MAVRTRTDKGCHSFTRQTSPPSSTIEEHLPCLHSFLSGKCCSAMPHVSHGAALCWESRDCTNCLRHGSSDGKLRRDETDHKTSPPSICKLRAERQPSAAAGSGSAADAGSSQLQGVVRRRPEYAALVLLTASVTLNAATRLKKLLCSCPPCFASIFTALGLSMRESTMRCVDTLRTHSVLVQAL